MTAAPARAKSLPGLPLRCALAGLAAWAGCGSVRATEWVAQPGIWWYLDYDTNRRLSPSNEIGDASASMTLDLLLRRLTETGELAMHPQVVLQRFTRETALDSNNGSLQLSASHREEVWSVGANATASRLSTLITELSSTGIIDASTRQNLVSGGLSASRSLYADQSLSATASYSEITYPDGRAAGLVGYHYLPASVSYGYVYSERTVLSLIAFGSDVLSESGLSSKSAGMSLQWRHALTHLITMTASAGATRNRVGSESSTGSVWSLALVHATYRGGNWSISVARDVEPNGFGLLLGHEEADLSLLRPVAPHLFITLAGQAVRNDNLITGATLGDRSYFTGKGGLEWRARKEWLVDFSVGYRQANFEQQTPASFARGWQGAVTLRWAPLPSTVSR